MRVTLVDPDGLARNYATGGYMPRTLVTEIRYPTLDDAAGEVAGAPPASSRGPFPVVVFAHGYDVTPDTYAPLLDAWVRAGFVVVAPFFPDENEDEVAALGGPYTEAGFEAQDDKVNEPQDLAYVIDTVAADAARPAAGPAAVLWHLADPSEMVLAGQSDGAEVAGALGYSSSYASLWASLAVKPRLVAVLSGAELGGSYAVPASDPVLLVVQSATDGCNWPQYSTQLYDALGEGGGKWFLELDDSTHLGPYDSESAAGAVVQSASIALFDRAVGRSAAEGRLVADVARSGVASLSDGAEAPPITPLYPDAAEVAAACSPP